MSVPVPCPDSRLTVPDYVTPRKSHSYRSGMLSRCDPVTLHGLCARQSLHQLFHSHKEEIVEHSTRTGMDWLSVYYISKSNTFFLTFFHIFSRSRTRSPTVDSGQQTLVFLAPILPFFSPLSCVAPRLFSLISYPPPLSTLARNGFPTLECRLRREHGHPPRPAPQCISCRYRDQRSVFPSVLPLPYFYYRPSSNSLQTTLVLRPSRKRLRTAISM